MPTVDFSHVPSDVSLALAQSMLTGQLADEIANALDLPAREVQMLFHCLVGGIAQAVDEYCRF